MSLVHLHLFMNHVPVIGILFVVIILIAALRLRSDSIGKLALVLLGGVAAVSAIVYFTGEPAEDAVEKLAGVSRTVIHDHEEAAEVAFVATAFAGVAALAALWWYRAKALPRALTTAMLVAALAISGLMAWTANLGGQIRHSEIRSASAGEGAPSADDDDTR